MLTHKPKSRSWYNCLTKLFDRWLNNINDKLNAYEERPGREEDFLFKFDEKINKALHLPPLDAKNPYRFW